LLEKMVDTVEPIRATSMSTEEIPKKLHAYLRPTRQRSAERPWVGAASRAQYPGREKIAARSWGSSGEWGGAHVVLAAPLPAPEIGNLPYGFKAVVC
jgi:hypothetical protein